MATTVSFNVNDILYPLEVTAVAALNGYTDIIPDPADPTGVATIPNPVTPDKFLKLQVKAWLRNQVVEYSNRQAITNVVVQVDV